MSKTIRITIILLSYAKRCNLQERYLLISHFRSRKIRMKSHAASESSTLNLS